MIIKRGTRNSGRSTQLLFLVLAFLLPTGFLLWFMVQAMRNEHLAVRHKLMDAYHSSLDSAMHLATRDIILDAPQRLNTILGEESSPGEAQSLFPAVFREMKSDSAVILDWAGGLRYPDAVSMTAPEAEFTSRSLNEAMRLENELQDYPGAADLYARAALEAGNISVRALALQGQARSMLKCGRTSAALEVLLGPLEEEALAATRDPQGRLIQCNSRLLALELLSASEDPRFAPMFHKLARRLADYRPPSVPASQRLFIMEASDRLWPDPARYPTLEAERLARLWADEYDTASLSLSPYPVSLRRGVWAVPGEAYGDGRLMRRALALYKAETLATLLAHNIEERLPDGLRVQVYSPGEQVPQEPVPSSQAGYSPHDPLVIKRFSATLPGWAAVLYPEQHLLFQKEAGRRTVVYLWTGLAAIICVAGIVLHGGRIVIRQSRLTRLKNDLLANVSHELKTPVSSMRLLVDTLRDDPEADAQQRAEYLDLIAEENARLSRLIDNFLTFSRMERNKHAFDFQEFDVRLSIDAAVRAAGEKLTAPNCRLELAVSETLPLVLGDRDALVSVFLNLLDNAWKYSGDEKRIWVRADLLNNEIRVAVTDDGLGIPRQEQSRVFDRFYQVDQTLARPAGGCGLGLSIAAAIVRAHGGTISVQSEPGQGSTFTVQLPVAGERKERG